MTCASRTSPPTSRGGRIPSRPQLLAAFPDGLVTVEVAQVCRDRNDDPDPAAAAAALERLEHAGDGSANTDRR